MEQQSSVARLPDIHTRIAAEIFNVPPERVTAAQRQVGKEVAYAAEYGVKSRALAAKLNVSYEEARFSIERASQILAEEAKKATAPQQPTNT